MSIMSGLPGETPDPNPPITDGDPFDHVQEEGAPQAIRSGMDAIRSGDDMAKDVAIRGLIDLYYRQRDFHKKEKQLLEEASERDPRAGKILNRSGFDRVLSERLQLDPESTALIIIDINSFKELNDRYSHPDGDHAIEATGTALGRVFREDDVLGQLEAARIGGDEFAVILSLKPGNDSSGSEFFRRRSDFGRDNVSRASAAARRARSELDKLVETEFQRYPEAIEEGLGFSIGVAVWDSRSMSSASDLERAADSAMYKNKHRIKAGVDEQFHLYDTAESLDEIVELYSPGSSSIVD